MGRNRPMCPGVTCLIRIALIGAGGHALGAHAPALVRYAHARPSLVHLDALCDLDLAKARAAAQRFGFARATDSLESLIGPGSSQPQAFILVTPPPVTADLVERLLPTGLPLLIEKPLADHLSGAQRLADAVARAQASGRVMVSFNRRFDPALTRARDWLARQAPPHFIRASMTRAARAEPNFLWGTAIHVIDALNHLAGPLELLHVHAAGQGRGVGSGPDTSRLATLRNRDGAVVALEIFPQAGEWEEHFRFLGPDYQLDVDTGVLPPWRVRAVQSLTLAFEESAPADEPPCVSNGTYAETAAFLDAILTGRPTPAPTVAQALESSLLTDQIARLDSAPARALRQTPPPDQAQS